MIYISRNRGDENGVPIKPPQEWFETAESATELAIKERGNHSADGNIYGHRYVRSALEKLFYDKCAYCESKMTAVSDWDVEHFRPKGRVAERRDDHPGYYWLTYDWSNLYPACTHCNQHRRDKPRWGDLTYATAGGKMDQFPLKDEGTRAMSHNEDVAQEQILLLDPCNDDPEQYLIYDIYGQIHAREDNLRGLTTIDICNLKRRRLRDSRREVLNMTADILRLIRKHESNINHLAIDELKAFMGKRLMDDSCRHAGAARAVKNDPDAFGV